RERLRNVGEVNAQVAVKKRRAELLTELETATAAARIEDATLKAIAKEKADKLAAVKFPVDGLSFDEDGVTYNGLPLAQASGAEKRVVGFGIAAAMNPELRVIRIDEGESIDSAGLAHIAELAAEKDMQVWISRVDESGTTGVVIEDGQVKS